jgi:signal transduction histidine kinase
MQERRTPWERLLGLDPRLWDAVVVGSMLALSHSIYALSDMGDGRAGIRTPDAIGAILLIAACLALYRRRRSPLAVSVAVSCLVLVYAAARYVSDAPALVLVVATYSAAAYRPRTWRLGAAIALAAAAAVALQIGAAKATRGGGNWIEWATGALFYVGLPVLVGRIMWNRRRRLDRDRDAAAREAVLVERTRIARELHDVVAHSLGVMVVQAGGARAVLRRDPAQAERALRAIEESGRLGLAEMRRLLDVERVDAASLAPRPGLDRLDELLERMRATGLPVELVTEGRPRPVPAAQDVSAYRIVQEALTNVLKHAGSGAHARVLLRFAVDAIEVEVADDGAGPVGPADGGVGLIGMRERVGFLHGELTTGPRPGGGFVVRARLPVPAEGDGP